MAGATAALHLEDFSPSLDTSAFSSSEKDILQESLSLTFDYLSYRLRSKFDQSQLVGLPRNFLIPKTPSTAESKLRSLAFHMEGEYPDLFETACSKLDFAPTTARSTFYSVATEIFQTGINWGRIVALFTFGGVVAHHFMENERPDMVTHVACWIPQFIADHLLSWITDNGGWDGFVKYFSESSPSLWKGLFAVGSICAAGFTMLALNINSRNLSKETKWHQVLCQLPCSQSQAHGHAATNERLINKNQKRLKNLQTCKLKEHRKF